MLCVSSWPALQLTFCEPVAHNFASSFNEIALRTRKPALLRQSYLEAILSPHSVQQRVRAAAHYCLEHCCRRAYVASFLRRRCAMRTRSRRAVCAAASDNSRSLCASSCRWRRSRRPRRLQPLKSSASRLRPSSKTRPEQVQQQRAPPYGKSPLQRAKRHVSQVA